jgi:hypothetical protein
MQLPATKNIATTLGAVAALVITILTAFTIVHWTSTQTTDVTLFAGAVVGFIVSLIAHFRPDTVSEPVAVGWWHLDDATVGTVMAAVVAVFGGGATAASRSTVTPVSAIPGPIDPAQVSK